MRMRGRSNGITDQLTRRSNGITNQLTNLYRVDSIRASPFSGTFLMPGRPKNPKVVRLLWVSGHTSLITGLKFSVCIPSW